MVRLSICKGPSRWDLMIALFHHEVIHGIPCPSGVSFHTKAIAVSQREIKQGDLICENVVGDQVWVDIKTLTRLDVGSDIWAFKGRVFIPYVISNAIEGSSGHNVRGEYSTKTRCGWLTY